MARLEPTVQSGSLLKLYQALWAPYYQAVLNVLGSTGIILPIGDPHHGQPNATTFTTKGEEQVTFTWSEAPGSFDTPLDLTGPDSFQGIVPVVTLNGTDEEADSPDAAFWSVDDSGDNGFSLGIWVNIGSGGAGSDRALLSKWSTTGGAQEWLWYLNTANALRLDARDRSVGVVASRTSDANPTTNVWHHYVMTYDGTGGATAADGITFYEDGAVVASTAANNGSYVAMENQTAALGLGAYQTGSLGLFDGKIGGGPLGPWFVTHNTAGIITPDEVRTLYDLGRAALAL